MIKLPGGAELRNLQEQVQKNKCDIEDIVTKYSVLADYGIHVIGQLDSPADIPVAEYVYGDAFLIGEEAPYNMYIFTRGGGEEGDGFRDIGPLSIVGPQGPQGPQGIQGQTGPRGSKISISAVQPATPMDNDVWITPTGGLLIYLSGTWHAAGSILGPQGIQGPKGDKGNTGETGPQGPKGDKGDVGGFINIRAIIASAAQLPLPTTIRDLSAAYLVGPSAPYDLYVQIGSSSETAIWSNTGPFNAATLVTVGGEGQNVWDADQKVDVDYAEDHFAPADVQSDISTLFNETGELFSRVEAIEPGMWTPTVNLNNASRTGVIIPGMQEGKMYEIRVLVDHSYFSEGDSWQYTGQIVKRIITNDAHPTGSGGVGELYPVLSKDELTMMGNQTAITNIVIEWNGVNYLLKSYLGKTIPSETLITCTFREVK